MIYYLRGRILAAQNKVEASEENLFRAKEQLKISKSWHTFVHCNILLVDIFEVKKSFETSIEILEETIPIAEGAELIQEYRDICFTLQGLYKELHLVDKAYDYLLKSNELKDILHKREFGFFQNQTEDQHKDEIDLLSRDLEFSNQKNISLQEQLEKTQENLTNINKAKESVESTIRVFAQNLRYPMNNLYRMAQILCRKHQKEDIQNESILLDYFLEETKKLDDYFSHLTKYSNLNKNENVEDREISTIKQILDDITREVHNTGNLRNDISIIKNDSIPEVWLDEEHFKLLFTHLVLNIVSLTALKPSFMVEINVQERSDEIIFEVIEMRAMGIVQEKKEQNVDLPKIYDLLKILDFVAAEGVAASLALCQKIVHLYKGSIWATFIRHKGFMFTFKIKKEELFDINQIEKNEKKAVPEKKSGRIQDYVLPKYVFPKEI